MKYIFKSLIVLFVLGWCLTTLAQPNTSVVDQTPYPQKSHISPNQEAMWDLLLGFDVTALSGAAGNAGAEFDGTYLYATRWASNFVEKFDAAGTVKIEEFSIPGVSGLRDLAYDGQYMYGGAAANTIYQMDFVSKTLVGTIPSPVAVRFIAYDEGADAFWCGTWSDPPTLVSRSGTTLASFSTGFAGQYGAAYDNVSPGGPYLWIFDQGSGAGFPQIIYQFNISTGTQTGVTHDVTLQFPTAAGIAGGLFSMCDWQAGTLTLGGLLQGVPDNMFIYEIGICGPPCPVGAPDNPNPANGTTNVSINLANISWTNGSGTSQMELKFGKSGSMTTVYSGVPITSWAVPGPLDYMTTYTWQVIDKNDTCSTFGPTWAFTTIQNPNLVQWCDNFASLANWVWIGPFGQTNWSASNTSTAGGTAPEMYMNWSPSFTGVSLMRSNIIPGFPNNVSVDYSFNFYLDWYANPSGIVTVGITYDGGATVNNLYTASDPTSSIGPIVVSGTFNTPASGSENLRIEVAYNGYSFNINWISFDNMCLEYIVPVELTSFTANGYANEVELNWITSTEKNNQGFEVQRSNGGEFEPIAFVEGNGTTTETHAYAYTDKDVKVGQYSYRLKQVDFDGTFEYSSVVEANVSAPTAFVLEQNYPNPFNPSTAINFQLKVDSKVSLKVFDILGQEVATLVNGNLVAGSHTATFNASQLNSGVYMYRLEATGADGSNFISVKKMMLTK